MSRLLTQIALLAIAATLPLGPGTAHADATLESVSGSAGLAESDHQLSLRVSGGVATATVEQTLVNRGKRAREALYTFELPGDAAVTDVRIQLADGQLARAHIADAGAAIKFGTEDKIDGATPDAGVLRLVERHPADPITGGTATAVYELRVWPVEAGRAVSVRTEWVAPLRYDDGRLSLRIPGRGNAANLTRETVALIVSAPDGAKALGAVHGGGQVLAKNAKTKRAKYKFSAPVDGDLVVEVEPRFGKHPAQAIVSFATAPVTKQRGVIAVSVIAPKPPPSAMPEYERVIIVVDVSRSMTRAGLDAASTMIGSVLDAAGHTAEIEVVLFNRTSLRLFGELRPNDRKARAAVERALTDATLANGSDLGIALEEVRNIFSSIGDLQGVPSKDGVTRGLGPTTLVAIITDGMTPLGLTPDRASDRIGETALVEAEVLAITIVPDTAPAPDTTAGPLGYLARKTGGRSIAVKISGADARAKALTVELTRPPSIEIPSVDEPAGTRFEGLLLPPKLEPGRGVFAIGTYEGKRPTKLTVSANIRGTDVSVRGKRAGKALQRAVMPLYLASADIEDFVPEDLRIDPANSSLAYDKPTLDKATKALLATADKHPAVTEHSSLVATDAKDKFANERFAFADRWGASLFFRVPPPPELFRGHKFREYAVVAPPAGNAHPGSRPTGDLDFTIVARLMRTYVLPKAQACYRRALRKHRKLAGNLTVIVEIARGEVQDARVVRSTLAGAAVDQCVLDAAYSIRVPRVALGDDTEYVGIATYPIKFSLVDRKGTAARGNMAKPGQPATDDPLGGLPIEK